MKTLFQVCLLSILSVTAVGLARAQPAHTWGEVCTSATGKSCDLVYRDFAPHDLSFNTGRSEVGAGKRIESNEFYAVVLKSVPSASTKNRRGCTFVSEVERRAAQKILPNNKVFASRNSCVGTLVIYEGVNVDFNFLAVYGGQTNAEAEGVLIRAKKRYPDANIRKMRVVLDLADE